MVSATGIAIGIVGLIAIGIAVVFYLKQKGHAGEYIWLGSGDDPFKKD